MGIMTKQLGILEEKLLAEQGKTADLEAEVRELKDVIKELRGDRDDLIKRIVASSKLYCQEADKNMKLLSLLRDTRSLFYDQENKGSPEGEADNIAYCCSVENGRRVHNLLHVISNALKDSG